MFSLLKNFLFKKALKVDIFDNSFPFWIWIITSKYVRVFKSHDVSLSLFEIVEWMVNFDLLAHFKLQLLVL